MTFSDLSLAYVWRAKGAACLDAYVINHNPVAVIEFSSISGRNDKAVQATPDEIAKFIERSVADIQEKDGYKVLVSSDEYISYMHPKSRIIEQMRTRLIANPATDDTSEIEKVWSDCEEAARTKPQGELVQFLRDLVCNARDNRKAIASGIIRNWIPEHAGRPDFSALLALGLLGKDGKECAATKDLGEETKERLRAVIAAAIDALPATSPAQPSAQ
jgi:hypothetical protein